MDISFLESQNAEPCSIVSFDRLCVSDDLSFVTLEAHRKRSFYHGHFSGATYHKRQRSSCAVVGIAIVDAEGHLSSNRLEQ